MDTTALDPTIVQAFAWGLGIIALLAASYVGVRLAGVGVRVGMKWFNTAINKA